MLGDFFRRRSERKFQRLTADLVCAFLLRQTLFENVVAGRTKTSLTDDWASGYVLGALDEMLQHSLIEHESEDGIAIIVSTVAAVFRVDPQRAHEIFQFMVVRQVTPDFHAGRLCGGNEMQRHLAKEHLNPLGLARYLHTGERRVYEDGNVARVERAHSN